MRQQYIADVLHTIDECVDVSASYSIMGNAQ